MKFLLPLRLGLRSARDHLGLALVVYLASLVPAAVVAWLAHAEISSVLDHSLFAAREWVGNRYGIWGDLTRGHPGDLGAALRAVAPALLVTGLLHVLVAAGVAEALLERERQREHPFLLGIGRHGWRFLRSALLVAVVLAALGFLVVGLLYVAREQGAEMSDGRVQLWGWIGALVVGFLVYIPVDLAYDLSRVSAAAHDEGRTLVGFFRALGHSLRHPLILAPLWLFFILTVGGLQIAYVVGRGLWAPESLWQIGLLVLAQQVMFLLAAFFRVGLWGAEIAYFHAVGEPHWCGKRRRRRKRRKKRAIPLTEPVERDEPAADDTPGEDTAGKGAPAAAAPEPTSPAPEPPAASGEESALEREEWRREERAEERDEDRQKGGGPTEWDLPLVPRDGSGGGPDEP